MQTNLKQSVDQQQIRRWRRATMAAAIAVVVVVGAAALAPRFTRFDQGSPDMLAIHLLMELFAVIVAMLVVVISWHSFDSKNAHSTNTLICGFVIVASCDLVHALSYDGMLPFLAESSSHRAIFFWLIGRSVEVATLGLVALRWAMPVSRGAALAAGVMASVIIVWFGSYQIDTFPLTFIKGQGVTPFKAAYEYVLCGLNLAVAMLLWVRAERTGEPEYYMLGLSSFVMGVGETMFTSYVSPSDFQNIFGHGMKLVAYALLYRSIFVVAVRTPYRELRQSQAHLSASEERFRAMSQMSSDWYWEQDADLRFVSASGDSEVMGGITQQQHLGRQRWELPDTEIIGQTWAEHQAVLQARKPFRDLILKRTSADGKEHIFSVAGEPRFDAQGNFTGYRGVACTVTDLLLAQKKAQESSQRLQMAIENLNESIVVTDADDCIVMTNKYFRTLNSNTQCVEVGTPYETMLRAGIKLGNFPEAIGREEAWLAERMEHRRHGGTTEIRRQDNTWLRVTNQRLPDGGTIGFSLDITDLKHSELALREANTVLEKRVAERTAEIEAFMYTVSHDLRSPIRAIDGYTALLQSSLAPKPGSEEHELFGQIRTSTVRMSALLQDLLDLSLYSTKDLLTETLEMRVLVDSVIDEIGPEVGRARFEVGPMPSCKADRVLIRQVWINLISNAVKYSAKSTAPVIRIGHEEGAFFVADNGAGFDMGYADKLFKLFSRLHHERDFAGTGIGLAIVKRIVERHGGGVTATAEPGRGATFRFTLTN